MSHLRVLPVPALRRRVGRLLSGLLVTTWLVAAPLPATGQAASGAQPAETGADALRVFLDCDRGCDFDYLRQEITFVNYVRDRRDAQVHVLVTREFTAAGGQAFTLAFVGLEDFAGFDDELVFFSTQDDTDDAQRRGFAQVFQLGLMSYVARTSLVDRIEISHEVPVGGARLTAQPEDDPWNFWVFRTRLNTRVEGEDLETSKSFGGSISANRTTDAWKMLFGVNVDYDEDSFELSDGRTLKDVSRNNAVTVRVIKSIGERMGVGFGGSAVTTTFRNQELTWRVAPAFQFNVFPYSESTRRELTLTYAVGYNSFDFKEPTIFGRTEETRINHNVLVSLDTNQPWGRRRVHLRVLAVPRRAEPVAPGDFRERRVPDLPRILHQRLWIAVAGAGPDLPRARWRDRRGDPPAPPSAGDRFGVPVPDRDHLLLRIDLQQRRQLAIRGVERRVHPGILESGLRPVPHPREARCARLDSATSKQASGSPSCARPCPSQLDRNEGQQAGRWWTGSQASSAARRRPGVCSSV